MPNATNTLGQNLLNSVDKNLKCYQTIQYLCIFQHIYLCQYLLPFAVLVDATLDKHSRPQNCIDLNNNIFHKILNAENRTLVQFVILIYFINNHLINFNIIFLTQQKKKHDPLYAIHVKTGLSTTCTQFTKHATLTLYGSSLNLSRQSWLICTYY